MIVIHYIYIAWDETVDGLTLCYRGAVRVQSTGRAGDTGHGEQGQYSTVQYSTGRAGDTGHGEQGQWHNGASRHGGPAAYVNIEK